MAFRLHFIFTSFAKSVILYTTKPIAVILLQPDLREVCIVAILLVYTTKPIAVTLLQPDLREVCIVAILLVATRPMTFQ